MSGNVHSITSWRSRDRLDDVQAAIAWLAEVHARVRQMRRVEDHAR